MYLDNAWLSLATDAFYTGGLGEAVTCCRRALRAYARHTGPLPPRTLDIKVAALAWGGLALIMRGQVDEGLAWIHEARDFARQLSHSHSVVFAWHFVQLAHYLREDPAGVLQEANGYGALCKEQGFPYWLAIAGAMEGWARVRLGESAAVDLVARSLASWQRTGAQLGATLHFGYLADAMRLAGRPQEGLAAIGRSMEYVTLTGEVCYEPHIAALQGRLLLGSTPPAEEAAEESFGRALDLARRLGARWLELLAARDLALLWIELGRAAEARALLRPLVKSIRQGRNSPAFQSVLDLLGPPTPKIASSPKRSASGNGRNPAAVQERHRSDRPDRS